METILVFRTGDYATWQEKLGGVADCAREHDWNVQVVDARRGRIDVARLVSFWNPCGAVVDASAATAGLRPASFARLPTVLMTPQTAWPSFPSVTSDSQAIARIAAVELLARDNQSFLFVDWPSDVVWAASKRAAFADILKLHGHDLAVFRPTPREMKDRAKLVARLAKALAKLARPAGVFTVTDALGAIALDAARYAHLAVPEDVAVVGVDDDAEICENCRPTLSSVRPSFRELGFAAGNLLRQLLANPRPRAKTAPLIVPPLGLVRRESSVVLKKVDAIANRAAELIRRRATRGLTPPEVLALFPGSPRLAEIRFKAAIGCSVRTAILNARLDLAKNYLASGDLSVAAVANFCGWKSDLAFRKSFKARFGHPPTGLHAATVRRHDFRAIASTP